MNINISVMKKSESKKYWFVRKSYWWWRIPASIEWWIVIAIYMLLVISRSITYSVISQRDQRMRQWTDMEYYAGGNLVAHLAPIILLSVILLIICYKTWETPKRQWWTKK